MKTIEIVVDTKGESSVQTKGFSGSSCREASRLIERALGTVQSDTPTGEMYQTHALRNQINQGGS